VLSKRQKENAHITCENIPIEGRCEKMAEGVRTTAITVLGLTGTAAKAFAMIILPAVLLASGVTDEMVYLLR
jgi:hypothetical protein